MNFYRRFPGDYLIETMTLSWLEDCAYTRLLDWQYRTERSIEGLSDAVSITRARTADEKRATKAVYERYFPRGINKRFAEELTYTNEKSKKAKEASALGVAARKKQPNGQLNGQSNGQPNGDLSQTPDSRRQTPDYSSSITSSQDHLVPSLSNPKSKSKSSCPPSADEANAAASQPSLSEPAIDVAALLHQRILENNPQAKVTARQVHDWAVTADLMFRVDHRTPQEISALIQWSQQDSFWKTNILSMKKLREKFDQLVLKRDAARSAAEPVWKKQERAKEEKQRESVRLISALAKGVRR